MPLRNTLTLYNFVIRKTWMRWMRSPAEFFSPQAFPLPNNFIAFWYKVAGGDRWGMAPSSVAALYVTDQHQGMSDRNLSTDRDLRLIRAKAFVPEVPESRRSTFSL